MAGTGFGGEKPALWQLMANGTWVAACSPFGGLLQKFLAEKRRRHGNNHGVPPRALRHPNNFRELGHHRAWTRLRHGPPPLCLLTPSLGDMVWQLNAQWGWRPWRTRRGSIQAIVRGVLTPKVGLGMLLSVGPNAVHCGRAVAIHQERTLVGMPRLSCCGIPCQLQPLQVQG